MEDKFNPREERKYENLNSDKREETFFDRFKTWEELKKERYNCC